MATRGKAQPAMFRMEGSSLKPQAYQLNGDMVADL